MNKLWSTKKEGQEVIYGIDLHQKKTRIDLGVAAGVGVFAKVACGIGVMTSMGIGLVAAAVLLNVTGQIVKQEQPLVK